jgi:hypothetical protein
MSETKMDMREVGISGVCFGEISHPGDKTKGVANCTKRPFFSKKWVHVTIFI